MASNALLRGFVISVKGRTWSTSLLWPLAALWVRGNWHFPLTGDIRCGASWIQLDIMRPVTLCWLWESKPREVIGCQINQSWPNRWRPWKLWRPFILLDKENEVGMYLGTQVTQPCHFILHTPLSVLLFVIWNEKLSPAQCVPRTH